MIDVPSLQACFYWVDRAAIGARWSVCCRVFPVCSKSDVQLSRNPWIRHFRQNLMNGQSLRVSLFDLAQTSYGKKTEWFDIRPSQCGDRLSSTQLRSYLMFPDHIKAFFLQHLKEVVISYSRPSGIACAFRGFAHWVKKLKICYEYCTSHDLAPFCFYPLPLDLEIGSTRTDFFLCSTC